MTKKTKTKNQKRKGPFRDKKLSLHFHKCLLLHVDILKVLGEIQDDHDSIAAIGPYLYNCVEDKSENQSQDK